MHRTKPLLALLALVALSACTGDGSDDDGAGSTSSADSSSASSGATTGGVLTSETSSGSSGEGSTGDEPLLDMGAPITPDYRPSWGDKWGPCHEHYECPLAMNCTKIPPNPLAEHGICTSSCGTAEECYGAPVCEAAVVCDKLWGGGPRYCLLACDPNKENADCPIGSICTEAVNAEPQSLAQWICL